MKIQKVVVCCCVLLAVKAQAQVTNDDCVGGFAQGAGMLVTWSTDCSDPANSNNGAIISDSTHLAVPNFPYPTNPSPCIGYTPMIAAPANDRWYALQVGCELGFTAECSDTCHISFWSGNDCGSLVPLDCYTILPNTLFTGAVYALGSNPNLPDPILLQISGNDGGQHTHYTLCLTNPVPPCNLMYVEPEPTPVTCFLYETMITPASSSSNADGAITVEMEMGNGPFELLWENGDTEFGRTGLNTDWYSFSITDAEGCTVTDSAHVPVDVTVDINWLRPEASCGLRYDAAVHGFSFDQDIHEARIMVTDATGRIVWGSSVRIEDHSLVRLPKLSSGLHVVRSISPYTPPCTLKFLVLNP